MFRDMVTRSTSVHVSLRLSTQKNRKSTNAGHAELLRIVMKSK